MLKRVATKLYTNMKSNTTILGTLLTETIIQVKIEKLLAKVIQNKVNL